MHGSRQAWWRRHERLVDVGVAVAAFTVAYLGAPPAPGRFGPPDAAAAGLTVALLAVGAAALLLRRARPVEVWCVTAVTTALGGAVEAEPGRGLPLAAAALYAVARYAGRRAALVAAALTAAAAVAGLALVDDFQASGDPRAYAAFAFCGLAAALGDAVRTNRRLLDDAEERARAAEASREEEARRRVAEERLRISRDLHDVVGHHLAVVTVQAGVADHVWESDPAAAREAVRQAQAAAAGALRQTSRLVGLLRGVGDDPADPAPSFDGVRSLVDAARAAGTDVTWTHAGPGVPSDRETGAHAYRVVQEALTNAVRHGRGPVSLTTSVAGDTLTIEVANPLVDGAPAERVTAGHGLEVMRERVTLVGGVLAAGRAGSRFVVRAEMPVQSADGAP